MKLNKPNEFTAAIAGGIITLSQETANCLMHSGIFLSLVALAIGLFGFFVPVAFLVFGIDVLKGPARFHPKNIEDFRLMFRMLVCGGGYIVTGISIDAIRPWFNQ